MKLQFARICLNLSARVLASKPYFEKGEIIQHQSFGHTGIYRGKTSDVKLLLLLLFQQQQDIRGYQRKSGYQWILGYQRISGYHMISGYQMISEYHMISETISTIIYGVWFSFVHIPILTLFHMICICISL